MKMDDGLWYVWSGWWNGMDSVHEMEWKNIRNVLQFMTCFIHLKQDIKFCILTWKWNEWKMEWNEWDVEWSEIWMMDEMEYGWISGWSEMKWNES